MFEQKLDLEGGDQASAVRGYVGVMPRFSKSAVAVMIFPLAGWILLANGRVYLATNNAVSLVKTYLARWPIYFLFFAVTILWEWWRPAETGPGRTRGLRQDIWWFLAAPFLGAAVPFAGVVAATWAHQRILRGFALPGATELPTAVRIVAVLLVTDLLLYLTHVARHRVPVLWRFHAVHHSQSHLNFFTEERQHPIEVLFARCFIALIFLVLGVPRSLGVPLSLLTWWHGHLVHANVRSRLGPLGAVFVSPQWHRVHHSRCVAHFDRNYGTHLTVWDRLFGTALDDPTLYPPTGLSSLATEKAGPMAVLRLLKAPYLADTETGRERLAAKRV